MTATFAPSLAARTAANTPVQLPPTTHTSASNITGMSFAFSVIVNPHPPFPNLLLC
jgi:hypothetical protein